MNEKPRREQATAPAPPSSCDPARTPGHLAVGGLVSEEQGVLVASWPHSVVLSRVRGDQRLGAVLWCLAGSCSQALHGLLLVLPSLVVE